MSTAPTGQKLIIILKIAHSLRDEIIQIIDLNPNSHSHLLKELQNLPINKFVKLSKKALSEYNASTYENSPLSIPVKRIIEIFTETDILINMSSLTPKRSFFSTIKKINLEKLQKNLTAINEVFNMLSSQTSDLIGKNSIKGPSLGN